MTIGGIEHRPKEARLATDSRDSASNISDSLCLQEREAMAVASSDREVAPFSMLIHGKLSIEFLAARIPASMVQTL
jgi:hypothetical protein